MTRHGPLSGNRHDMVAFRKIPSRLKWNSGVTMSTARMAALAAAILIHPIAWPAWSIELIVRRWKPSWQFNTYTGAIYLSVLTLLATAGLLTEKLAVSFVAIYVLSAMEILALWTSTAIAFGRPTTSYAFLRVYGRRRGPTNPNVVLLESRGFLIALLSYGFTVYYFAALYFFVFRVSHSAFSGLPYGGISTQLGSFFYFSATTIATVGYGDIHPNSTLSRMLAVIEIFVGMAFALFIFAAFVSFHISRIRDRRDN
jgi:hypothetical protein